MIKRCIAGMLVIASLFCLIGCAKKDIDGLKTNGSSNTEVGKEQNKPAVVFDGSNFSDVKVGEYVCFGSYEQDNNPHNGKERLEWLVLDEKDGKKLLISRHILTSKIYSEVLFQTWEKCSLREWLNKEFYSDAFSAEEKRYIATAILENPDNDYFEDVTDEFVTKDKVFLLGANEAEKYLGSVSGKSDIAEKTTPTEYAIKQGMRKFPMSEEEDHYWCLLRSNGYHAGYVAVVNDEGKVNKGGVVVDAKDFGVRPVIWICENWQNVSDSGENTIDDTQKGKPEGEYVFFGIYEQDNNRENGKEEIEWLVLERKNGEVLLISKYGLETRCYDDGYSALWKDCALRKWLNESFFEEAFMVEQRENIVVSTVQNPENPVINGIDSYSMVTEDKVFLLSVEEANKYFATEPEKEGYNSCLEPTKYVLSKDDSANGAWWLRSNGHSEEEAAVVQKSGEIRSNGWRVDRESVLVRPVIRVKEAFLNNYINSDLIYDTAMQYYKEGDYYEAAEWLAIVEVEYDVKKELDECRYNMACCEFDLGNYETAIGLFEMISGYKDANERRISAIEEDKKHLKEGTYIKFGTYEQDNSQENGAEEIEWLVLDVDRGEALLISKYILDANKVEDYYDIWENRPLREWLNSEFYDEAFSVDEKNRIIKSRLENPDNDGYFVNAGTTEDYVFLLSVNEAIRYFGSDENVYGNLKLATSATKYASEQGVSVSEVGESKGNSAWDLRSNGYHEGYVACVSDDGSVYAGGNAQASYRGIRPAIRIKYMEEEDAEKVNYRKAVRYFEMGEYEKAETYFMSIKETEDVREKVNECKYIRATQAYEAGNFGKAKILFSQITDYKDAKEMMLSAEEEELRQIEVGSSFLYGVYEQDNNTENGLEPIEWQVLEIKDNKMLLISKYVLDVQMFDDDWAIWEKSFLRSWLNNDFYNIAFSEVEKKEILTTKLKNSDSYLEPDDVSAETKDKVFLLSVNEVVQYFGEGDKAENSNRTAAPTAYAVARGVNANGSDANDIKCWWHLRSNGIHDGLVIQINVWGQMVDINKSNSDRGVRPVICVDVK